MASRFGFWAAVAAAVFSVGYDIPQILQAAGVLTDPWDRILIFAPSLALAPSFVLTMAALHDRAPAGRTVWSLGALALAVMYATLVSTVYITQLSVVIPHDLRGDGARYALLACCGHNEFLTGVDLLGYTLMGLSTLLAAPAVPGSGPAYWARLWLVLNAILTPFIFLQVAFPKLIYIASPWIVTFPLAMLFLALVFARDKGATLELHGRGFDARMRINADR
jgi:hypothetical protein